MAGLAAYATRLSYSTDGTNFTPIAEVVNLSGPGLTLETIETTSFDSQGWREFIGGLLDGGEVQLELNFLPASTTHRALLTAMTSRSVYQYRVTFPDNTQWTFKALVTKFEPQEARDERVSATVTLKVTGQPTLT